MYADDLVLFSTSRFHLQQSLATLSRYVEQNDLVINVAKTKAMKFRRGGRQATSDECRIGSTPLEIVSHFPYLGVYFSSRGTSFSRHVDERISRGLQCFHRIPTPHKLTLSVAIDLFDLMVNPTASYGVQVIWPFLTRRNFQELDKIKAAYLKRVLKVHRLSPNRLVYLIAGTPLFIEDLQRRYNLPRTRAFQEYLEEWEGKLAEVHPLFFQTQAMTSDAWKRANNDKRHLVTRFAVHGFHHEICTRDGFHEISPECLCKLCHTQCDHYHLMQCTRPVSLHLLNNM